MQETGTSDIILPDGRILGTLGGVLAEAEIRKRGRKFCGGRAKLLCVVLTAEVTEGKARFAAAL
ncbi:hypothetical protein [Syntrophothermus sp.]|uniref:hypothetical protein n=1 Tax=Syntrophothermus sp. TaxID=2736299 RepID=UPI00338F8047